MNSIQKNILVTVDGSENSKRTLLEAKKFVNDPTAKITLLTVVKPMISAYYDVKAPRFNNPEEMKKAGKAVLDEAMKILGVSTRDVIAKVRRGNPADEIINEAEYESYDLVIMGSRGLGTFSRTFIGSVSDKVLHHVDTDVLIVH